ncbi:MAG TPA: RluA family pseudouridine synthase [Candidatus Obscuribacterales bacterium]
MESSTAGDTIQLIVSAEEEREKGGVSLPQRLDNYLAARLPNLSRARAQKLIESGFVLVDERPAKASHRLKGGEILKVTVPPPEPLELVAEDIPLSIVYQDADLAVVNKASGMVTHPGAGVSKGTLVNALLSHIGESLGGINGTLRPGIVHRLDKDTSGLLVIAKTDAALRHLQEEIKARKALRRYIALVEGVMMQDDGTISQPIGRHPTRRKEMWVVPNGRPATTHYKVIKRFQRFTLLQLNLETGRTHQIRVHMSYLGFPVVGDVVYNRKTTGSLSQRHKLGLLGHALHAAQLSFTHPTTGRLLEFEAPLPRDFQALLEAL